MLLIFLPTLLELHYVHPRDPHLYKIWLGLDIPSIHSIFMISGKENITIWQFTLRKVPSSFPWQRIYSDFQERLSGGSKIKLRLTPRTKWKQRYRVMTISYGYNSYLGVKAWPLTPLCLSPCLSLSLDTGLSLHDSHQGANGVHSPPPFLTSIWFLLYTIPERLISYIIPIHSEHISPPPFGIYHALSWGHFQALREGNGWFINE